MAYPETVVARSPGGFDALCLECYGGEGGALFLGDFKTKKLAESECARHVEWHEVVDLQAADLPVCFSCGQRVRSRDVPD